MSKAYLLSFILEIKSICIFLNTSIRKGVMIENIKISVICVHCAIHFSPLPIRLATGKNKTKLNKKF